MVKIFGITFFFVSFVLFNNLNQEYYFNNIESNKRETGSKVDLHLVKNKLDDMTLREKIAQMIVSSAIPENYDENSNEFKRLKKLCEKTEIGGFIFFKGSSKDYASLSNKLQRFSGTPLIISADFERGTGMRVTDGTLFPNNMAIGATNNPDLAYQMGLIIAAESRSIGVGQDYAPVCDVNNNPNNPIINVRSFGEDPVLVSKMSEAMIKGIQENIVIATAKHFPGHGDTEIDSHIDLPVLSFSMDRLNKIELVPFKNAISKNVMSVMIAHLSFPELEPDQKIPASLSKNIVQNLLIDKLEFNGLVVTDALNMQGITKYYNTEQVAVMCVTAGIDLILMPLNEEKTINAIERAVNKGIITEDRINRSTEKILKAKQWLGLFNNKFVDEQEVSNKVNDSESNALAQKIADESITLVKDERNSIPINKKELNILVFNVSDGKDNINSDYFTEKLKEKYPNSEIININSEINSLSFEDYRKSASRSDIVICGIFAKIKYGTGKISLPSTQIEFIKTLPDANKQTIVISFGNPYLLKDFSTVPNYICAYGDANVSVLSVIKAISGEISMKGKLPVTINEDYKLGSGIQK
jgi:beta-N-acetylhexosaminidase